MERRRGSAHAGARADDHGSRGGRCAVETVRGVQVAALPGSEAGGQQPETGAEPRIVSRRAEPTRGRRQRAGVCDDRSDRVRRGASRGGGGLLVLRPPLCHVPEPGKSPELSRSGTALEPANVCQAAMTSVPGSVNLTARWDIRRFRDGLGTPRGRGATAEAGRRGARILRTQQRSTSVPGIYLCARSTMTTGRTAPRYNEPPAVAR
jgi:hypothetical protein